MNEDSKKELGQVIRIDDEKVQDYLRNAVRGSVCWSMTILLRLTEERHHGFVYTGRL